VLGTLGPWCLHEKKLVVPREKLERQRLKLLFFSPLMTVALATVIPNMLRLATENLIKRARLFLQMKGGHFEHLLYLNYSFYFACFLFHLLHSTSFKL
jgi:hypothetical protein